MNGGLKEKSGLLLDKHKHTQTHTHTVPVGLMSVIIMKYLEIGHATIRQTDLRDGGNDTG